MLAIAVLVPVRAFAQTPPAEAPPPAAAPPAAPPPAAPPAAVEAAPAAAAPAAAPAAPAAPPVKITWGGLVDAYYLFNFLRPDGSNTLLGPAQRAYDTNANSMTLALTKLTMNASIDPVSFQLDLGYGTTATWVNSFATNPAASVNNPAGGNVTTITPVVGSGAASPSFFIEQAYGEIALPGNLTLDVGKFTTTAGAEVIEANKNWLYSRSILFNNITILHTGVRANLKISDQLTLQASFVNGWNNDPDQNAWKTGGVSATFTASPALTLILTTYFGKEGNQVPIAPDAAGTPTATQLPSTPGDIRLLVDFVGAFTVNDKLGLNLNIDYVKAYDDVAADYWVGVAAMGRYVISDHVNVAARGEWVRFHQLATNSDLAEGTFLLGLPVAKNFEFRPEVRYDHSTQDIGPYALNGKKSQFTFEFAALAYF